MSSVSSGLLDPRIKDELDRLNNTSAEINRLEMEIDNIRHQFRQTLTESSQRLKESGKKCINAIQKAHPYHEAKKVERQAHESAQDAALKYQRAVSMFRVAKETIAIAEHASMLGVSKKRDFDSALQEMLNHATGKLNAAEKEKITLEAEHESRSRKYIEAQKRVEQLFKKRRKAIAKSGDYFDLRNSFYNRLEGMKNKMEAYQRQVALAKTEYRQALKSLERISDEIHQSRQLEALLTVERSRGVGADSQSSDSDIEEATKRLSLTKLDLDEGVKQSFHNDVDVEASKRRFSQVDSQTDAQQTNLNHAACAKAGLQDKTDGVIDDILVVEQNKDASLSCTHEVDTQLDGMTLAKTGTDIYNNIQ